LDDLAEAAALGGRLPSQAEIAEKLISRLYEADYTRAAYFHLYNVDVHADHVPLVFGWDIVPLSEQDAAALLNEPTLTSRLHFERSGNAFLRFVAKDGDDDSYEWLHERWGAATYIVRVFKFLKYETVDLDWAGYYVTPEWCNQRWKYGITILGTPRWDV